MSPDKSKRIKMCRYCDGMIEWGTEVCPHCGRELVVEKFDDLEFIPTDVSPGRNMPTGPPPIAVPVDPEPPPVVAPITPKKKPPVVAPRRGGKRRPAPPRKGPPVVKPVAPGKGPPVVKPVAPPEEPPIMKPIAPGKGPPVMKPIGTPPKAPPVVQPVDPPVVQPVEEPVDEPPLVSPIPVEGGLPPGVEPIAECPICGADTNAPDAVGATCGECHASVCLACLMRANGVRAGDDMAKNRKDWEDFLSLGERTTRCPACGRPGI